MLFLAGADHERYGKVKWTRQINLQSATVSLQVVISLCKRKETAALKFKAAVSYRRVDETAVRRFFSFAVLQQIWQSKCNALLQVIVNLFILLSNHIYWQQHTAKEHSQENIFPYVFPYICYNAARHDVDNREQYHTQAQTQAESSHNMWPVAIIEFYSRHIHAEWAIIKNVYTVFIIKA